MSRLSSAVAAGALASLTALLGVSSVSASPGLTPSPLDFGNVPINTTAHGPLTLTADPGFQIFSATGISGLNPPFGFLFGTCNANHSTCNSSESFSPHVLGPATASLSISECPTAGGLCNSTDLDIQANAISLLQTNIADLHFGDVALGHPKTLAIPLSIDAGFQIDFSFGPSAPFSVGFGDCVGATGTCNALGTFDPTGLGAASDIVTFAECPIVGGACINAQMNVDGNGVLASSAPEAPVWAMMLVGLGGLGASLRGRRRGSLPARALG